MAHFKDNSGPPPSSSSPPYVSWVAGIMIGTAIMTMATQAMALGVGMALNDATLKGR